MESREKKEEGRERAEKKRREKRWRRVLIKRGIGFTLDTKKTRKSSFFFNLTKVGKGEGAMKG